MFTIRYTNVLTKTSNCVKLTSLCDEEYFF
jgi:hypothetical protein